ncbi:MAG: TetR/AcrR family transcriptional regulator [Mycobacterium sp.]|uniref:TetR family transcriptional regulator n=1 Tax=Mycobacterium sp. TaxID=1785 RepID=UPI003CC582D7
MARQVRSEATRQKIIDAAIDVFNEVGYTAAGRGEIIERAGMTKGALYHHFDSMESLASAIIDEGAEVILAALGSMSASSPALENMVHGTFVIAELLASDRVARASDQLILTLGKFNEAAFRVYTTWLEVMSTEARRAIAEGDLRADLDVDVVSESIVGAMYGNQLLCKATSSSDLTGRLSRMWELLFPALVEDASVPYFREFLAREALRHVEHNSSL